MNVLTVMRAQLWQPEPPTEPGSYVILWDNGSASVEWDWFGVNANMVVGHLAIPAKPPLSYNPRAYRDVDDRGWVGQFSWPGSIKVGGHPDSKIDNQNQNQTHTC